MRAIGEKGFILGGLVTPVAVYSLQDSNTLIHSDVKIAGGILLIAYGVYRILI